MSQSEYDLALSLAKDRCNQKLQELKESLTKQSSESQIMRLQKFIENIEKERKQQLTYIK